MPPAYNHNICLTAKKAANHLRLQSHLTFVHRFFSVTDLDILTKEYVTHRRSKNASFGMDMQ